MNRQQPTDEYNPSAKLSCPHCHTQLPLEAVFCSSCGKRVKKIGDWQIDTEDGNDNTQEADVDTVRLASNPQKHLRRSQSSRPPRNSGAPEQPHLNGPLLQDAAASESSSLETAILEPDLADARVQHEAPIPGGLSQPLPTTPVPSIPETWQQVPDTEVPVSKTSVSNPLWPIIIILSAVAAGLVNFVFTDTAIRPVIVFWFLFVCPGMVLVRFIRLKEPVVEWTLAIVLSFAIEATVAGIQLYVGKWSPTGTLNILIVLSLVGAVVQLAPMGSITIFIPKQLRILHSSKLRVPSAILLARIKRFGETQVYPRLRSLTPRTVRSATMRQPNKSKPKSSVVQVVTGAVSSPRLNAPCAWKPGIALILLALLIGLGVGTGSASHVFSHTAFSRPTVTSPASRPTATPTPLPTIHPLIAGTYNGTISDLSSNESASFSLSGVRQSQGKITGYLVLGSRLSASGPFSGTIDTAKHLQFTLTDATGQAKYFFEGTMQSATSLSGDYYQCSPSLALNGRCIRAYSGYGIWNVVQVS